MPPSATAPPPAAVEPRWLGSAVPGIRAPRWELAVAAIALVSAAVAFWVTLRADFLAHPAWLAVQKADFILGPVFVGLYWRHRRPASRFGVLLIVLGLMGVPYVLQSLTEPTLFGIGVVAEDPIYVMTTIVILAFPTGRLPGLPERLVVALLMVTVLVVLLITVNASRLAPGFSISECRAECPGVGIGISSWRVPSQLIVSLAVAVALATAVVIAWRFATGTPPRRRALAIGAPIAVLFLLTEAAYRGLFLLWPGGLPTSLHWLEPFLQWSLAVTRALIWYGFLCALIAAELQAGRVLKRLVNDSLGRPSFHALEGMLRRPLGDPGLRLGFRRSSQGDWVDAEGAPLEPPGPGQALTEIERKGPGLAIVHDTELLADPELLQAAGAAVLLAEENAELEAAWNASLRELAESRARLVSAGERERRKLERDLHDGAQQRLTGIQIKVRLATEQTRDQRLADQLEAISVDAEQAVEELRTLAHGIYPPALRAFGLADALEAFAMKAPIRVAVEDTGLGRCPRTTETAIYFCATEAVQNAIKHAGDGARVTITLARDREHVRFAIADDGRGMAGPAARDGQGLIGMRDRIGAVGGDLEVVSSPGTGTTVRGTVPLAGPGATDQNKEGR